MTTSPVLVVGATGLLGSALSPRLSRAGIRVVRHGSSLPADVTADLRDRKVAFEVLDRVMPSTIVNCVALTDVDGCQEHPQVAYLLNVHTTENIAAWVKGNAGTRLVQISSDHVYDGPGPHREGEVTLLNIYAYSKYCAELVAASADATVLRTNFFGHPGITQKTFVDGMVANLRSGSPVRLVTDVLFSPLYIDTLCDMIRRVLERPVPGTFNVGSHGGMSKSDFGRLVALHLGLSADGVQPVSMADLNLKARRPNDMTMDVSLFEATFGVRLPDLTREILLLPKDYGLRTEP